MFHATATNFYTIASGATPTWGPMDSGTQPVTDMALNDLCLLDLDNPCDVWRKCAEILSPEYLATNLEYEWGVDSEHTPTRSTLPRGAHCAPTRTGHEKKLISYSFLLQAIGPISRSLDTISFYSYGSKH